MALLAFRVRGSCPMGFATRQLSRRKRQVKNCSCRAISTSPIPELNLMKTEKKISNHQDLYEFSLDHPEEFWGTLARSRLTWRKPFEKVMDCDFSSGKNKWFIGGEINVSVNCVDRHAEKTPDRVALIWEKDEPNQTERITYKELSVLTNKMANLLKSHGVEKGDRVAVYMATCPLAVAAMLGCARIGAVHSVAFAGFSAEALVTRINDAQAKVIITTDQITRGGKKINLKATVDEAMYQCPTVEKVFVNRRSDVEIDKGPKDVIIEDELDRLSSDCPPLYMESNDPLFMLYTSGSTGKPKGLIHSQAGYLLYAAFTHKHVFDFREGDIFGCVGDLGWITGHSYVMYGPLCNGGTTLLFEGLPTYPNPSRYWAMVEKLKLTHFYCAPTAIRLLIKCGDEWVQKNDKSSLRVLASVGEPLNLEAWNWYHKFIGEGKKDVVDTWWQTETGGICLAPRPSEPGAKIIGGKPMRPMFGIDPVLVDENGEVLPRRSSKGSLCLRRPWPGLALTVFNDHKRFIDTYFGKVPGMYLTGDSACLDQEGFFEIAGRIDDVINVTGHRLGTAEVEAALNQHPAVAESAVVGYPHDIKGEGIYAYVILKDAAFAKDDQLVEELRVIVRKAIAGYAVPDFIQVVPALPKTRSGKIMRRILREIAKGAPDDFGDMSTLAEPNTVNDIVKGYYALKQKKT